MQKVASEFEAIGDLLAYLASIPGMPEEMAREMETLAQAYWDEAERIRSLPLQRADELALAE